MKQPLPASRFGKDCPALHNEFNIQDSKENFCSSPRSQNLRDVRRHHATSKRIVNSLPFRAPIAGLSRLEFYQSRGSTSCRCSHFLDMQLRTAPIYILVCVSPNLSNLSSKWRCSCRQCLSVPLWQRRWWGCPSPRRLPSRYLGEQV